MRAFISSVRRGLGEERDALRGLISALGHVPVRFEDFTAQPVPSRQACMEAVSSCDICLLLLGPSYGDRLPDTGVAPTHEEFNVARSRGIPLYAFLKRGVEMDADQRAFVSEVEQYATGRFRAAFDGATDLLTAVTAVVRQHESMPSALAWERLPGPAPAVPWVAADQRQLYAGQPATVEMHVLPLTHASRLAVGQLEVLGGTLAGRGREHGLFTQAQPVDTGTDGSAAWARSDDWRQGVAGVRVDRDSAISLWWPLPSDGMGAVVDSEDLASAVAAKLRFAASLGLIGGDRAAVAAALSGVAMAAEGSVADLGKRNSVSFGFSQREVVRVEPEDAVPVGALTSGAGDIGRELATRLVHAFRASRR
ncbi:DUF4062 domain-containing protein [Egibacter rhizosphaerae]|uniref:DUF4062 domain-containing protein n=1 Tax=Egibacter rhizosphaerae TaxID=1670831 RepID=A0A411YCJ6_9ACTN|nr:DUF4062 domain-containing protein [Egibacter rhizosphaerae]QBI18867.1 DUF4062 domain-containing protein [Egibacter rhizosphaerae]